MCSTVPFSELVKLFRANGYEIMGWRHGRPVFDIPNDNHSVAFAVPVDENKRVCKRDFERIKKYFS